MSTPSPDLVALALVMTDLLQVIPGRVAETDMPPVMQEQLLPGPLQTGISKALAL